MGARSSRLADSRRLAARAAALANAQLDNLTDLQALLSDQPGLRATVTTADVHRQRLVRQHLRKVFDDVAAGQEQQVVQRLNTLLARYRVRPTITGTSPADWHISLAAPGTPSSVAYLAATVWGLAVWLCQRGIDRLGVCAEPHCHTVFLDHDSNRRRRFCSERCATRAHVRAHRARQRATRS
ncbi:CGNR zinc finger domain-containing protein [Verrucosispora sioxanthis]|uniref:CGNR zinc finger domain-containing protein n=1 Tax=Verrucosispora sioxanthis TaxID=2499994 RepID=UPI0028166D5F|nr:CGNR zinc finger domain-containing protein [Verrucosispora sioxanthis]